MITKHLFICLPMFFAAIQLANSTIEKNVSRNNVLRDIITHIEGHLVLHVVTRENGLNDCPESEESPLDEFPEIFTEDQLRQGAIALHIFAAIYFFILLAMVCNDYFLPTVECICDDLHLSKDVAAATFMATATSMPEFFTNTISTLITQSDMGLGTVIGSLMFNTLGVAGLAALCIQKPVQLDWWPIARDCFIYMFNTVILLIVAWGGQIRFIDTCVMMLFLILYYVLMFNNNTFMKHIRVFVEDKLNCCFSTRYDLTLPPENSAKAKLPVNKEDFNGNGVFVINTLENNSIASTCNSTQSQSCNDDDHVPENVEMPEKLFSLPHGQSRFMNFWWAFTWPIKAVLTCLIPNPITNRKLYPLTFIMCILMIGCNAYLIVWMLTALGVTLGVPEIVMGLTFLAAGSATPEAISSLISLRKGESGIGVSNSLGANSLAILLSLGVPWFIKNCMNFSKTDGTNVIHLTSQGIEFTIIILMASTIGLFVILSFSGYRLTKRAGIALFSVYGVFIVLQILMEMNVFFPKTC